MADTPLVTPVGDKVYRYPETLCTPPYEKWMLFEVRTARHIGRTGLSLEGANSDRTLAACALYLPENALQSTQRIEWVTESYGAAAGAAIEAAFQRGSAPSTPTTQTGGGSIQNLLSSISNISSASSAVAGGVASGAAAFGVSQLTRTIDAANKAIGIDASGSAPIEGVLGKTVNPRTDIFFKNVDYRTHNFNFTLIPRTFKEAQEIDNILNLFHFYSLPSYGSGVGTGEGNFFIGYPYEFVITIFTQVQGSQAHHLNTIGRSVLTSIEVNHAGGNQVAFVDSVTSKGTLEQYFPAVTTLNLAFKETRLLGRDSDVDKKNVIWRGTQGMKPSAFEDPRGTGEGEGAGVSNQDAAIAVGAGGSVVGAVRIGANILSEVQKRRLRRP